MTFDQKILLYAASICLIIVTAMMTWRIERLESKIDSPPLVWARHLYQSKLDSEGNP